LRVADHREGVAQGIAITAVRLVWVDTVVEMDAGAQLRGLVFEA